MGSKSRDVGVAAVRGVFWTSVGQVFRQAIQIVTSVVLARLLAPDDFGLLGMALVFTGVAQLFTDFGIGTAIVHSREVTPSVLSSCFWANVAVGCGATLLLIAAAPWIAAFYAKPELLPLIMALSVTLLLSTAGAVPGAILLKQMHFDRAAKAQVLGGLTGSITAMVCAWHGLGVWSLVVQPIVGSSAVTLLSFAYCRWRPGWELSLRSIRNIIEFSANVLGCSVFNLSGSNSPPLAA